MTDDTDTQRVGKRVSETGSWWDVLLLAAVPTVLVAVFALPQAVKWRLAFRYTEPTVTAAFASHFVHLSSLHLLVNLVGVLLVVPTGYLLSASSARRGQFLTAFVTFVFAFPFALSGLNLVFVRPTVGVGFSGVVLAFVGYLGIAVMDFWGEWYDAPVDGRDSAWLFFLAIALLAFDVTVYGPAVAFLALLASALFLRDLVPSLGRERLARVGSRLVADTGGELAGFAIVVFLVYPTASITTTPDTANGIVNVYTHLLGFCLGYIVTYVLILIDRED